MRSLTGIGMPEGAALYSTEQGLPPFDDHRNHIDAFLVVVMIKGAAVLVVIDLPSKSHDEK